MDLLYGTARRLVKRRVASVCIFGRLPGIRLVDVGDDGGAVAGDGLEPFVQLGVSQRSFGQQFGLCAT